MILQNKIMMKRKVMRNSRSQFSIITFFSDTLGKKLGMALFSTEITIFKMMIG